MEISKAKGLHCIGGEQGRDASPSCSTGNRVAKQANEFNLSSNYKF